MDGPGIYVGKGENQLYLLPKFANRHGLIAGATGTGKTVTLQILAEGLSAIGVPVFLADVKGDLSGLAVPGGGNPKLDERAAKIGLADYAPTAFPTVFWDLFGEKGHPIRTTVSEMGPLLLSRLLELNDTQEGVLNIVFKLADDEGLLLLDLKDLRSMLAMVSERATELSATYGNVAAASVGAIQRSLLVLEQQGGDQFFGEPALNLIDFMRLDPSGKGIVSILAADKLMQSPRLYSTFLLWLLSELFEDLPEVGDPDKPKLVFFFDEAHLLFEDAPKALVDKIEQVVKLIRSKGVGVFFVTQNPIDIPDAVLGQLGNRIQHALRAFTPKDQKAVRASAETFRPNPGFKTEEAITQLGVGEALVSLLGEKGAPGIVERTLIRPPRSRMGPIDLNERMSVMAGSPVRGLYDQVQDRESAFELLQARAAKNAQAQAEAEAAVLAQKQAVADEKERVRLQREAERQAREAARARKNSPVGMIESAARSAITGAGRQLGTQIVRGILGSFLKGR
ncbi:MAG: DUF853 domain-containing protein [Fimbriimonadaceae bacterium]|nr:DUF853 family protein [Chthonomonadaceae bacterium]MCO5296895.1 DUF853 domain-containing protein [Fimbriimonadaceae bacterium]